MYTTTFSSVPPGPTTTSSLVGGVEYIFAQFGSEDMLIVLGVEAMPSTVTLPPTIPPPCFAPRTVRAIVKQIVTKDTENKMR
jgi:hypothetical protein